MKLSADAIGKYGETKSVVCPKCEKSVNMQVLRSSLGVGVLGVSLFNYKHNLFTICPECHALFAVDDETSQEQGKGSATEVEVAPENLTYLQTLPIE